MVFVGPGSVQFDTNPDSAPLLIRIRNTGIAVVGDDNIVKSVCIYFSSTVYVLTDSDIPVDMLIKQKIIKWREVKMCFSPKAHCFKVTKIQIEKPQQNKYPVHPKLAIKNDKKM